MRHMIARDSASFQEMYSTLATGLLFAHPFDRGEVHAQKTTTPEMVTRELLDSVLEFHMYSKSVDQWQQMIGPNLPWAEDHFLERVSGEPLNPPPSEAYWPYAQQGNAAHKDGDKFSHTYPERFWPMLAGDPQGWAIESPVNPVNFGIRFRYGDLHDLVEVLKKNPKSRQAYLPVWFPEDLAAASAGLRVPCTLGYHFLLHDDHLFMTYYMRSCDLVRFFKDDVYMAGRLLQWVCHYAGLRPGPVNLHVANLHAFAGDLPFLEQTAHQKPVDRRVNYNFGAL